MKNFLKGKKISILGDSISTFRGYIPTADGLNLAHRARYPQDNLLSDVNLTWWMRIINECGAHLGINDSWAGSTVGNKMYGNKGDRGEDAAMASLTRIKNLGANGAPDVIFFFGGTNDMCCEHGDFDEGAEYTVELSRSVWDTTAEAYTAALLRMRHFYPEARIISLLPGYALDFKNETVDKLDELLIRICRKFEVDFVDLRCDGITRECAAEYLPDDLHPNAEGMRLMAEHILRYEIK